MKYKCSICGKPIGVRLKNGRCQPKWHMRTKYEPCHGFYQECFPIGEDNGKKVSINSEDLST